MGMRINKFKDKKEALINDFMSGEKCNFRLLGTSSVAFSPSKSVNSSAWFSATYTSCFLKESTNSFIHVASFLLNVSKVMEAFASVERVFNVNDVRPNIFK